MEDNHFKIIDYFQKSTNVFPTVDIKGGVAIGYRDANANFGKIGFFSPFAELRSIVNKVSKRFGFNSFANIISSRGMYRFSEDFFKEHPEAQSALNAGTGNMITSKSFALYPNVFTRNAEYITSETIQLYGRESNTREFRYIERRYVLPNNYLDCYNVFVPEANGTGTIGEVLSTPIIGTPMIGHTDTFISIGQFECQAEAEACLKYIKTKFARTMLGTLKATQHNPKDTWANVPLQDFTASSDINWSQSIPEIDHQLYIKYKLTNEEISFIESMIKPM